MTSGKRFSGKTTTMDTKKLLEPVIFEIPERGRQMSTKQVGRGTGVGGEAKRSRGETYHEGYVGDKKFLVPDSTLKAMADIINLKVRKYEDPKNFKLFDPDDEEAGIRWWHKKRDSILNKLDSWSVPGDSEEGKSTEGQKGEGEEGREDNKELKVKDEEGAEEEDEEAEEEIERDEEVEGQEGEEEDEEEGDRVEESDEGVSEVVELKRVKKVSEEGDQRDREESLVTMFRAEELSEEFKGSRSTEEENQDDRLLNEDNSVSAVTVEDEEADKWIGLAKRLDNGDMIKNENFDVTSGSVPDHYRDPNVKRFLISGHFRSNRKPIYIVQQLEGPSLYKHRDPEFFSHKCERDVDISMCGEFFKESILEEDRYMQPVSLKTSPRKVAVDWTSRVYEEEFTQVFVGSEVDVQLSGSFTRHSNSAHYTPVISIVVRKGTGRPVPGGRSGSASVFVARPMVENLFEREARGRGEKPPPPIPKALFETGRGRSGGLPDPDSGSTSTRKRQVRRSSANEETTAEMLEAFVRTEGERRREHRRNERGSSTGNIMRQLFFWK